MKKIIVLVLSSLFILSAHADETMLKTSSTLGAATAINSADAASTATNQGNAQSITFTSPDQTHQNVSYSGSYTMHNVPSVNGPALTTSNDTCMGSTSGSVNIAGFGIGGGSTWTDTNCKRLKNSRELWNMGFKAASIALLCSDAENREALELTGFVCPQTEKANRDVAAK